MKQNKIQLLLLLLIILICCPNFAMAQRADKLTLKFAHVHPADPINACIHFQALKMRDLLKDKGIDIQVFPASQLGNQRDIEEQMRLGSIDLNSGGTSTFTTLAPKLGIVDMAYIWKDYDYVHKVLDGPIGTELSKTLLPTKLRVLAYSDSWGFRNVGTTKKRVAKLEDLKNLKIRTIQAPVCIGTLKALGAAPTPMAFGEIYTALQTNVIDGYEHDTPTSHAYNFDEVIKYYALTEHMFGPLIMVISEITWQKLTDEQKRLVEQAAIESAKAERALAPIREKENMEAMRKRGVEIIKIDKQPFINAVQSFNNDFAKQLGAEDIYQKILKGK